MNSSVYRFLYEAGQLKQVRRSGWWIAGIEDPESVAEHSFRTAVIGFILAHMEGADVGRTTAMCLLHDLHEARTLDLHKISQSYLDKSEAEARVTRDQAALLPGQAGQELVELGRAFEQGDSLEARLAREADALECLLQAREYQARGHADVQDWIDSSLKKLSSPSARQIAQDCLQNPPASWWRDLKSG